MTLDRWKVRAYSDAATWRMRQHDLRAIGLRLLWKLRDDYIVVTALLTRRWHVTISCQPATGWTPAAASSTSEEWTRTFGRGQQCSCFRTRNTFCRTRSLPNATFSFLSRVSILTCDIDIDENGFVIVFSPYGSPIILVLPALNIFTKFSTGR